MGKHGPCCHCGVPSTPLWRNGPPDKPVLCNACGSRWRTKGSLTNYTPLHARAEPDSFLNLRASRIKIISSRGQQGDFQKRKRTFQNISRGNIASDYNDGFWKAVDDDTSNRSSSGSAVSNSESRAQFDTTYVSELTGFSQSVVVDTDRLKPAKKRTFIPRLKSSSIATLTKDLCTILHQQQSSGFYGSSEEDLLFESDKSIFSAETGHGSYLIKDTSSITREEDSEASSFSVNNKAYLGGETCSCPKALPVDTSNKSVKFQSEGVTIIDRMFNSPNIQLEKTERNTVQSEFSEGYGSQGLPQKRIHLKDIFTHEESLRHLTSGEQEQLLKYSASIDDSRQSDSLQSLFDSTDFVDSFSTFQHVINEVAFNDSLPGVHSDDCNEVKRLTLCNWTKLKLEDYNMPKKCNQETETSAEIPEKVLIRVGKGKTKPDDSDNDTSSSPRNLVALRTC